MLSIDVGDRPLTMAQRVVHHVSQVLTPDCTPLFLTNGFREYMTALLTHFGYWVQSPRRQATGPAPKPRWQINTSFVERLNLTIRQHVAAVGRRVSTCCKGEDGLRQQLALFHVYHNFCLPHAALRVPLAVPELTTGTGSAKQ